MDGWEQESGWMDGRRRDSELRAVARGTNHFDDDGAGSPLNEPVAAFQRP